MSWLEYCPSCGKKELIEIDPERHRDIINKEKEDFEYLVKIVTKLRGPEFLKKKDKEFSALRALNYCTHCKMPMLIIPRGVLKRQWP